MLAQHILAQPEIVYNFVCWRGRKFSVRAIAMGGKTDLDRVVAYIPTELKQELKEWADSEERSVSWVVAKLIDRAVRERKQQQNTVKVVNMR
jgi:CopG-like RHH_1 or ribbon-helix-helix domain, RHH_5